MGEPVVRYVPRGDATPEQERETLASVYRFLLRRHAEKAADEVCPDQKEGVNDTLRKERESK